MGTITILVVDDNLDFLTSVAEFLAATPGLRVVGQASSGAAGIERARALAPDIVLMDVHMPGMSGLEATREIKRLEHAPRVLLTSMYDSADLREMAETAGADGYVGKWEFTASVVRAIEGLLPAAGPNTSVPGAARAARLRSLAHLNQLVSSSLDMEPVLSAIARAAAQLVDAPAVSFWVADERQGILELRAAWKDAAAESTVQYERTSVAYGEGAVGRVAATRRVVHIPEVARDPGYLAQEWARARGLTSFLGVPVMLDGSLLAVLALSATRPFSVGPEEMDILDAFISQAAAAIRNARLYEEVRRGRDFLHSIAQHSADGIVAIDPQGRITFFSERAQELFGCPADEALGRDVREVHERWAISAERMRAIGTELAAGREIQHFEGLMERRDGSVVETATSVAPIRSEVGISGYVAVIRDETELKKAQRSLREAEKLSFMGTLLAGVAHELNNPLQVVAGQSELLRERATAHPELSSRAEMIVKAAERCTRIVSNFLALARRRPRTRGAVALNDVVKDALELVIYPMRMDGVEVVEDLAPDLPQIAGDPHELHQVVINLATNAHHAMRGQAGRRRLTLATRHDEAAGRVVLEVRDTGPGVPASLRSRIFQPLFTTKPVGQGTGLGLSLCQTIVTAHEGTIRLADTPDGAAFVVELPVAPAEVRRGADPVPRPMPVPPLRILVLDDEMEVAQVAADMLAVDGHTVETETSPRRAIERLVERHFDVLLTDVRMPGMSGIEVSEALPWAAGNPHVIFMTGDMLTAETAAALQRMGAVTIGKPFHPQELRQALAQVLGGAA